MFSKSTVAAAVLSLVACVHADNHVSAGKPASIVGYTPMTDVRDQARIDLDQQAIESFLEGGNTTDYTNAGAMYTNGAHSKSVSALTLSDLTSDLMQSTKLMGVNASGSPVMVFVQGANVTAGATTMNVQYVDEGCYVGANIVPITMGCLAPNGTLTSADGNVTVSYVYEPLDTANVYDIKGFTQGSEYRFVPDGNLTVVFQKFVDFYQSETYADDIIMAALTGTSTAFDSGKDMDLSSLDDEGRIQVIAKGTSYMAIWMYVIRELEHAIFLCDNGGCLEESCLGKDAVHEVDEAVAFYAGSLEGAEGSDDGLLPYRLADKRAANFKTAGENGDSEEGTAKVNYDVIALFKEALAHILAADCEGLRGDTTKIVQKMTVPLVQGTLRYIYLVGVTGDDSDKSAAELAIFAAAVLPFVNACNSTAADLIYEQTTIGKNETDLPTLKAAFESVYACMGITGADVGGLWDGAKAMYFEGMEPMGYTGEEEEDEEDEGEDEDSENGGSNNGTSDNGGSGSDSKTSGVASIRGSVAGLVGVIASVMYAIA